MEHSVNSRQLAAGTVAISLCSLLSTIIAIRTYTQPDPDGTSLAGLFFGILLVVGFLSLGSGGLLAVHTRWGQSGTWPRRFLYTGASAGVLASALVIFWNGAGLIPETSALGRLFVSIGGAFFGVVTLSAATMVLCALMGLLTQVGQTIMKYS